MQIIIFVFGCITFLLVQCSDFVGFNDCQADISLGEYKHCVCVSKRIKAISFTVAHANFCAHIFIHLLDCTLVCPSWTRLLSEACMYLKVWLTNLKPACSKTSIYFHKGTTLLWIALLF